LAKRKKPPEVKVAGVYGGRKRAVIRKMVQTGKEYAKKKNKKRKQNEQKEQTKAVLFFLGPVGGG